MNNSRIIEEHLRDKRASVRFKERRFNQWNENYFLYRDKVVTNRLTQRQPVNIPIMRETIQTWISKIDEPPLLSFESRTQDNRSKDGEIVLNELWNYYFDKLKLDLLDTMEKKIVGLQGRGFKIWGFSKNEIFCDLIDPYDIEITSQCNPLDLNSAHNIIRTHIYKPLREILANPKYDATAKNELKLFLDSTKGVIKAKEMTESYQKKKERLEALGATNFEEFQASDVIVELNESYKLVWNNEEGRFVRHKILIAADMAVLSNKTLKESLGISMLPIVTWADDPDLNDLWCDGKGDAVRTINKVVNIYISQDLENRTFRNFGMYFYNTMQGKFIPKAFDAKPFGMYGVPGNPAEMMKQVEIPSLGDTNQTIQWLKDMIQSSVAQTPTERGVDTQNDKTLGEIKINLQQSTSRNELTAKNYRRAWKESGEIFYALLRANSSGKITLYKKGTDGEYRSKDIYPTDWQNPAGYECKVIMKSEKEKQDQFALEKTAFVRREFINNPVAQKLAKEKQLETLGWTSDEIQQVMAYEDQLLNAPINPEQATDVEIESPLQLNQPVTV